MGVVVVESGDTAEAAAKGPRSFPGDKARAWNVESVIIYEQLASA